MKTVLAFTVVLITLDLDFSYILFSCYCITVASE